MHENLIKECKKGKRAAQYEIYQLYHQAMYNTALRMTNNVQNAEDVLQESFVSAFKNLETYRGDASFGAWLKRIVINKALNQVQKNRKELILTEDLTYDAEETVTEEHEPDYTIEQVKSAMERLPTGFRTVLSLYLFEGYDHGEISAILGISESTSKTQYMRAKDRLKIIIREEVDYA